MSEVDTYGLSERGSASEVPAPRLDYEPPRPRDVGRGIGLIGCGGIAAHHLNAYRQAGFRVVALCDLDPGKLEARRREFFPDAATYLDADDLLADDAVEVVDATPHPADRAVLIEDALRAGKHVFSQKPFVTDLDLGESLADLAGERNLKLAVNQNGRWAPHFSYARAAMREGLLGPLSSIDVALHFDHNWTAGTPFERIHHLILYDFAIHWFDIVQVLVGEPAERVTASVLRSPAQRARPPLLAHALVDFGSAQATLAMNGDTRLGQSDRTVIAGSHGTLVSEGPDLNEQRVTLFREEGFARPALHGAWFDDGFRGAMAELLCAIEEDRTPENDARANLDSLALCFAAIASADAGEPRHPGQVRSLPASVFSAAG